VGAVVLSFCHFISIFSQQRMGIGNFFTTRRVFGFPTPGKERNFGYAICKSLYSSDINLL